MSLEILKSKLQKQNIFHSSGTIMEVPTVIGYDKKFKWSWMATQLNTFVVASDFGEETITVDMIERHLTSAFKLAKANYKGWPRGLQSGLGVVSILMGKKVDKEAQAYCKKLKSGKKWAGFSIPVAIEKGSGEAYYFDSKPMWGRIYYPYFEKLIKYLVEEKARAKA